MATPNKDVRLTDKEITALATKLRTKATQQRNTDVRAAAKKHLPEAKKILNMLYLLPERIKGEYCSYGIRNGNVSALQLAEMLVDIPPVFDQKEFEADVVLAANGCPTMAKLYAKLGL